MQESEGKNNLWKKRRANIKGVGINQEAFSDRKMGSTTKDQKE